MKMGELEMYNFVIFGMEDDFYKWKMPGLSDI